MINTSMAVIGNKITEAIIEDINAMPKFSASNQISITKALIIKMVNIKNSLMPKDKTDELKNTWT